MMENIDDDVAALPETIKKVISATERDEIMKAFVNELEDWKEKQQELYKCQVHCYLFVAYIPKPLYLKLRSRHCSV